MQAYNMKYYYTLVNININASIYSVAKNSDVF